MMVDEVDRASLRRVMVGTVFMDVIKASYFFDSVWWLGKENP